ncbi:hypothetical protein EDD11_008422 [Mortierella claussenii]|nr:hypothetical protein EDD11_008422 [Mortierella claussenii]
MSSHKDKKADAVDPIAEQERRTFGQQSPYATSSILTQPYDTAAAADGSTPAVLSPTAPQPAPSSAPLSPVPEVQADPQQSYPGHSYNPQDAPVDDQARSRKFNKFWLIFFAVVLILLILDDDRSEDDGEKEEMCRGRVRYSFNLTDVILPVAIDKFTMTGTGLISHVVVEQVRDEASNLGRTRLIIEASGIDREDIHSISRELRQDVRDGTIKADISRTGRVREPECLRAVVRIILPSSMKRIQLLNVAVSEGNLTVNLLGPNQPYIQITELLSRVITGHSIVRASVSERAKLGNSVGSIKGEIMVGKELVANLVQGDIALNLVQHKSTDIMESTLNVASGNLRVGLPAPYEGTLRLNAYNGEVNVEHQDPDRTYLSRVTKHEIRGWNSATGQEPGSPTSELRLASTNGNVTLSLARIEL